MPYAAGDPYGGVKRLLQGKQSNLYGNLYIKSY